LDVNSVLDNRRFVILIRGTAILVASGEVRRGAIHTLSRFPGRRCFHQRPGYTAQLPRAVRKKLVRRGRPPAGETGERVLETTPTAASRSRSRGFAISSGWAGWSRQRHVHRGLQAVRRQPPPRVSMGTLAGRCCWLVEAFPTSGFSPEGTGGLGLVPGPRAHGGR